MRYWIKSILQNKFSGEKINRHALLRPGKISLILLFLFFIISPCLLSAETSRSSLLLDPRISSDLFIPTLGKTFDSQAFIYRAGETDLSSFDCSGSNTHNKIGTVFEVDAESYTCGYRYETSITKRLRLQGGITGVNTGGGIFDSWISDWHDAFDLPNGHRDSSENRQHLVQGTLENGESFDIQEEEFGLLDPQLYASYLLNETEKSGSFFLNTGLTLPLQLSQFATKSPSFLFGLTYYKQSAESLFSVGTDLTLRTDQSDLGLNYEPLSVGAYLGWVRSLSDSFSFISSTYAQSSSLKDIEGYSDWVWYIDFGFRTDIIFSVPLEILIRENLYASNASTDVSLILRVIKF